MPLSTRRIRLITWPWSPTPTSHCGPWPGTAGPGTRFFSEDPLQASVVKGYVRHDIFVQRIYGDLPRELEARYGKGLLSLADVSPEIAPAEADRAAG